MSAQRAPMPRNKARNRRYAADMASAPINPFLRVVTDYATRHGWMEYGTILLGNVPHVILVHGRHDRNMWVSVRGDTEVQDMASYLFMQDMRRSGTEAYCWCPLMWEQAKRIILARNRQCDVVRFALEQSCDVVAMNAHRLFDVVRNGDTA